MSIPTITPATTTRPSADPGGSPESATHAAALDRSRVLDSLIDAQAAADPTRFRMLAR